jgi:acetolactate synthase-1/2/3 large subunit
MAKSKKTIVDRRSFLKTAAGAAGLVAVPPAIHATPEDPKPRAVTPIMPRDAEVRVPASVEPLTTDRPGSDFMVDVIKAIGFEYVIANPGSSFRALHESLINYGDNKAPEFITCCHEESSIAMAHGYAKIEGRPALTLAHGTVGLQHATMGIYNAFCDRAPIYLIVGNTIDATMRRPGVEWDHSVQDSAALVRDFVKWDDLPISLPHFAESAMRAYKIAMTPPMMPVLLVADSELQEHPVSGEKFRIPKMTLTTPPQGDTAAIAEAARMLVAAENPVLIADRVARTSAGLTSLVELAEALQAPVIDKAGRMNFPSRHPLNHSARAGRLIADADVIVGLELTDFWGTVNSFNDQLHRTSKLTTRPGAKLISITSGDLYDKSNYQDFQRYTEIDLAIAADAEATLPALTEAVKMQLSGDRKATLAARGQKLESAHHQAIERVREEAAYGWDTSPITTARLSAELWNAIKNEDWSLVSEPGAGGDWALRLWNFDKYYQFIGGSGGAGVGYGSPAAVGAALANRKHGRISVNIQNDGDLMYAPGVLWTAAHHQIPLLSVMHNNHAYHQELMHIQRMASRHNRGIERASIGTTLTNPDIDFAKLAQSMGWYAEGPITDPRELGPSIQRALAIVKKGQPALVDVSSQPR